MASPPPNVHVLRQKFEGDKKAKVPLTRSRSSSEFNVASRTFTDPKPKSAVSTTTRKFTGLGLNFPKDGGGHGRAFVLVSSPPARRVQRPKFPSSGSAHNQDEVRSSSTTSDARKTTAPSGRSRDPSKKPPLPLKPTAEFSLKHRSMSLGRIPATIKPLLVKNDDDSTAKKAKDSDPALQGSSQQLEEENPRPLCVAERAKRFGGEDRRVTTYRPPERRPPDIGIKFGGVSSSKWDRSRSTDDEDKEEHDKRETAIFECNRLHQESKKMGTAFGKSRAKEAAGLKQVGGKPQTQEGHPSFFARWFWRNRDRVKTDGQSVRLPRQSPVEEDDTNLAEGSRIKEQPVQDPVVLPPFPVQIPNNQDGDKKLAQAPLSYAEKPGSYPIDSKKLAMPLPENRSLLVGKARQVPKQQLTLTEDIIVEDKSVMSEQFEEGFEESELLSDILCTYESYKQSKDHLEVFPQEKRRQDFGSVLIGDDSQETTQSEMPSLPKPFKVAKTTKPEETSQDIPSHNTSVEVEAQIHHDEDYENAPKFLPEDVRKELVGAVSKRNGAGKQSPQVPHRRKVKPLPPTPSSPSLLQKDLKSNLPVLPCVSPIVVPQAMIKHPTVLAEQTKPSVDNKQGAEELGLIMQETGEETASASEQSQEKTPPSSSPGIQKPFPVIPKADCSPPPTPKMGNVLKPSPLSRKRKRPVNLPETENVPKALPKVPQGVKPPLPEKPIPSLLLKRGKRPVVAKTPSLGTYEKDESSEASKENQKKDHQTDTEGIDHCPENPEDGSEITPKQGLADGSLVPEVEVKTDAELPLLTTPSFECDKDSVCGVSFVTHGGSDNDNDNDNKECIVKSGADIEGRSPTTLEGPVIPLSQNPLLLQDEIPAPEVQRRRSSLHNEILVSASISNARGLFQKALKVSSEPPQTAAKPPVPDKPQIWKKPLAANSATPSGQNGRPNVSPKIDIPKRHNAAKFEAPRKPPMESNNIYDDVYHEAPSPPDTAIPKLNRSSKKLEQFFGEELDGGGDKSATANVGKTKKHGKDKQTVGERVRKMSPTDDPNDKDGPYAIIPIPDVDKTAAKKPNMSDAKSRKISNGNGQPILRNSGGMSSGDSGVLMHSDLIGQERKVRNRDRRMSRRILRRQMRSMDSDFAEDSDDEPIGTESDFDSDTSDDRLDDVIPEPVQFLDDTHKKAYEVLTTERTYVKNLYLIDQIFFTRITQENLKQNWFPPTVLMEIFSNISTIYRLHSDVILCALEKQLKDWETNPCLGEVLKDNAHFLKLYSYYVSNFDHAMKQLNLWTSKVPKFAAAISEIQQLPQCGGLALQHHMLTPVQRIPRYELLLKEYLRKLPDDARDRPSAEKALNIISGAAKHSNDMMKSMEQFEKLLKINEKIEGEDIIDPTRHLLKEGKITKIANKSKDPQDRYIYLFNDILLCCEKKRLLTASASYKVKLKLEVDGMKVLDSDNCRFIIEGKTKSIELQTNTEEDREDWMAALLSAIREMVRKKESFKTNDAVGDRLNGVDDDEEDDKFVPGKCEPRWIKDDETTMCMRCGTDFKLTKRRHHCRACGAVVCNKCSSFESSLQYDNSKMNKVCFKCYYTLKGDFEELKKMERRSLITELGEEASFGSFLYLQKGGWVKYWVVVTDQDLYALKAPKDVRSVLTMPIKLYNVSDVDAGSSDKEHVFKLTNGTDGRLTYTFAAESKEMKKRWIMVLTSGLEELGGKSQTI